MLQHSAAHQRKPQTSTLHHSAITSRQPRPLTGVIRDAEDHGLLAAGEQRDVVAGVHQHARQVHADEARAAQHQDLRGKGWTAGRWQAAPQLHAETCLSTRHVQQPARHSFNHLLGCASKVAAACQCTPKARSNSSSSSSSSTRSGMQGMRSSDATQAANTAAAGWKTLQASPADPTRAPGQLVTFLGATYADITVTARAAVRRAAAGRAAVRRRSCSDGIAACIEFVSANVRHGKRLQPRQRPRTSGSLSATKAGLAGRLVVTCCAGQASRSLSTTLARRRPANGAGRDTACERAEQAGAWAAARTLEHRATAAIV